MLLHLFIMQGFLEDTGEILLLEFILLKWSLTSCWWPKFRHLVKAVLPLWVMEKEESPTGGDSLPVLATYLQYVLNHCWWNVLRAYMNGRIFCYFACYTPCFWMPEGTWHESCLMTKIPYKHWILNINSSNFGNYQWTKTYLLLK